jgi:acyl carrier protein
MTEVGLERSTLIGRPVFNTEIYLVGRELEPVPVGVGGELLVGGDSLSRGYLNRPELTAEKFIPNPFGNKRGGRLYRTGDWGRYEGDGKIGYLGRLDHQVKIRGYRIELGEIEKVLGEHEGVRKCAVVVREKGDGEKRLVAYVVNQGEREVNSEELREHLRSRLPEYMAPAAIVKLSELPVTTNGKLDRKALPAPVMEKEAKGEGLRTPVEEIMAGIWSEVLNVVSVGMESNFFELGGHSLLATQVMSRIREAFEVEVPLRELFETPTVAGLAKAVGREMGSGKRVEAPPIVRVGREEELPLSFAQQRLWFIQRLEPESAAYNIPIALRLQGALDVAALRQSLGEIVRRHEALRTRFVSRDGRPAQVIDEPGEIELTFWDLSELVESEREQRARKVISLGAQRPFDLETGSVWRAALVRLGAEDQVLLVSLHHVASDGWSAGLMVREFTSLYERYREGQPSALQELRVQYADFALWQREWLQGEALAQQLDYWRGKLAGASTLELVTGRPPPSVMSQRGASVPFRLTAELTRELRGLSRREGVTLFMTLLGAFKVVLGRIAGQDDVVVGTDVANRNRLETEGLIGFFVNQLVLRTDLSGAPSFRDLLKRVRETTLGAYSNQDLPFERLVDELSPKREVGRTPLFRIKLVLQNAPIETLRVPALNITSFSLATTTAKFDLMMTMSETHRGILGVLDYRANLFDTSATNSLIEQYQALLKSVVTRPDSNLNELGEILDEADRQYWITKQRDFRRAARRLRTSSQSL